MLVIRKGWKLGFESIVFCFLVIKDKIVILVSYIKVDMNFGVLVVLVSFFFMSVLFMIFIVGKLGLKLSIFGNYNILN